MPAYIGYQVESANDSRLYPSGLAFLTTSRVPVMPLAPGGLTKAMGTPRCFLASSAAIRWGMSWLDPAPQATTILIGRVGYFSAATTPAGNTKTAHRKTTTYKNSPFLISYLLDCWFILFLMIRPRPTSPRRGREGRG